MRSHSAIATALLAEIGLADDSELWDLSNAPQDATGSQRAAARLAAAAALALSNIDDADRLSKQALQRLGELQATETANLAAGLAGNAAWLTQAAAQFAEQLAKLNTAIADFRAAAHPLALILGLPITRAA